MNKTFGLWLLAMIYLDNFDHLNTIYHWGDNVDPDGFLDWVSLKDILKSNINVIKTKVTISHVFKFEYFDLLSLYLCFWYKTEH